MIRKTLFSSAVVWIDSAKVEKRKSITTVTEETEEHLRFSSMATLLKSRILDTALKNYDMKYCFSFSPRTRSFGTFCSLAKV